MSQATDKLKHIPKGKVHYVWGEHTEKSEATIKRMLMDAGYSSQEIKQLQEEGRIVLTPRSLGSKIYSTQELYIIPPTTEEVLENLPDDVDRFNDLT